MSKIFISYSQQDREIREKLSDALLAEGHEVLGIETLTVGSDLNKEISKLLYEADAVIALLTENSISSKNVLNEITISQAQVSAMNNKLFLPLVIGSIEIPNFLRDTLLEMVPDLSTEYLQKVILNINRAVAHNKAVKVERQRVKELKSEQLEVSKTEFIREAEGRLTEKENSLKNSATMWYVFGYLALILGVIAAFALIKESLSGTMEISKIILLSLKGIIGVGLLVASSKYAFTLGKSYMNESLKNSDRLHAISFGKFYLQAYGDVASPEDVKDVFQHWNISKDSSFNEVKADSFDPRVLESAIEIARVMTKNDKKSTKNT